MKGDNPKPQVIVIKERDHGCVITLLLVIIAWPLALIYVLLRVIGWLVDVLTLGPIRRRL